MADISSGHRVRLRPITRGDTEAVRQVLSAPEVARWWGDPEEQAREVLDAAEETGSHAIETEDTLVGIIQSTEEPAPQYKHAGIDIAVHPHWHGRGIGPEAIHLLARHLITERGHHRLTIDPAADNTAAIRTYARLGFRRVGILRRYERGPDGTWRDGLLMDLLAHELRAPHLG